MGVSEVLCLIRSQDKLSFATFHFNDPARNNQATKYNLYHTKTHYFFFLLIFKLIVLCTLYSRTAISIVECHQIQPPVVHTAAGSKVCSAAPGSHFKLAKPCLSAQCDASTGNIQIHRLTVVLAPYILIVNWATKSL